MIVAIIALVTALTGSAYAAHQLGKNSVGTRQLKSKSVTTGKIARNAVNGSKVANGSLTGSDINIGQLGTVPQATNAVHATNADTLAGHGAACPGGTTLIRGVCFDLALNPVVTSVKAAADACAAKGGWLPTTLELYSVRNVINLGSGVAPDEAVADAYYANTSGVNYRTLTVDGTGTIRERPIENTGYKYICAYPLVR
jgi:hypothetical protein